MTPKEYFTQIFELDKKINEKRNERDAIMDTVTKATGMKKAPIYSNQFHSPTEETVFKLFEHGELVNNLIDDLVDMKIEIADEINQLKVENHRIVLKERYIYSKNWDEVDLEYDPSWITRLHKRALKEFEEKFPEKF